MKKALVVGIDRYPHSCLGSSVKDATAVASILKTHDTGEKNFDVKLITDIYEKSELRKQLFELFAGACETVLFYFSGHGMVNGLGGYITTPDGTDYDEGIWLNELLKLANDSEATNKIIILDSCYAGALGTSESFGNGGSYLCEGVTILTASRHNETALAKGTKSVFTSLLIEALKGGAADLSGRITPGSVYAFIDQALGPFDQRPVFKTNTMRFVPLRASKPHVPVDVLKKMADYFPSPEAEYALDPSCEYTNTEGFSNGPRKPYAKPENIVAFKQLQQLQGAGLVVPVNAPYMYDAAMNFKSCKLTPMGKYYWMLAKNNRIE